MLAQATDVRLIPGELPDSHDPEDARQWLSIYRELATFAERTLSRLQARPDANGDLAAMQAYLERLQGRLDFWERRFWQLVGLDLDMRRRILRYEGRRVRLTPREVQLLAFFVQRAGQDFTGEQLLRLAWRAPHLTEEQVRTYIVRLRRRLAEAAVPARLLTVPRRGYRLEFSVAPSARYRALTDEG